jgi:hypothetical protein
MPLHAFPNTRLHERLRREGRLLEGAERVLRPHEVTDLAVTGLNFVTLRPRVEILQDLVTLLTALYDPQHQEERVQRLIPRLALRYRHRPPLLQRWRLTARFLAFALRALWRPGGRALWRALLWTAWRYPSRLEAAAGLAVMHSSYAEQAERYIEALRAQIRRLRAVGEERYVARLRRRAG